FDALEPAPQAVAVVWKLNARGGRGVEEIEARFDLDQLCFSVCQTFGKFRPGGHRRHCGLLEVTPDRLRQITAIQGGKARQGPIQPVRCEISISGGLLGLGGCLDLGACFASSLTIRLSTYRQAWTEVWAT